MGSGLGFGFREFLSQGLKLLFVLGRVGDLFVRPSGEVSRTIVMFQTKILGRLRQESSDFGLVGCDV